MSVRHIAIVNFTRMGDLIQSGPLMRSLTESRDDVRITLVVFEKFQPVAGHLPMVDEVIGLDVDHLASLLDSRHGDLRRGYEMLAAFLDLPALQDVDEIYNLSHTPLSATLCSLIPAKIRHGLQRTPSGQITIKGHWFSYLLSIMQERDANPFNLVEIYRNMNPGCTARDLEFSITDHDHLRANELLASSGMLPGDKYMVLQAGASSASRQWPVSHFAELADRFAMAGFRVVLSGSKEESSLAEQIIAASHCNPISFAGQTDVGTLAAVLQRAEKLISNDTGTIHLAAAVGTPTVGIYLGPASAKDTAPYGNGHVVIEADLECAPCSYQRTCGDYRCHRAIDFGTVFNLAMAAPNDISSNSAGLTGIHVLQTAVSRDGEFDVIPQNSVARKENARVLAFYRMFWNSLLNGSPAQRELTLSASKMELDTLQGILKEAQLSFADIQSEASQKAFNAAAVSEKIRKQIQWHNSLRRSMEECPQLAPLARFLLVRVMSVRADTLAGYVDELRETLSLFERGVRLLEAGQELRLQTETVHASAV